MSNQLGPISEGQNNTERMIADSERDIQDRHIELMAMDALQMSKEIVVKALAHEELKSKHPKGRMNLAGMAAMLKLLMSMEGIEKASERDTKIDLPKDTGEAIDLLISHRGKGTIKSLQAKDLSELLTKRRDLKDALIVKQMLDEMVAKEKAGKLSKEIKITRRDEMDEATPEDVE
jgi:hypothetical protein